MKDYIAAKKNIFKFQTPQDYLIISRDNKETFKIGAEAISRRFWFSRKYFKEENGCFLKNEWIYFRRDGQEEKILNIKNIKILGEHNLVNVLAAVSAAMVLGVNPAAIKKVLLSFKGLPDRLEFLKEIRGVKYYNDTTATTPEATIAALKTLKCPPCPRGGGERQRAGGVGDSAKNIILIVGGADKGLDFTELIKLIKKTCKAVVLLRGTGTDRIKNKLRVTRYGLRVTETNSIKEAVLTARKFSQKGDIILLSPACASFGMFNNEFDRGEQFKKIIKKIK